MSHAAPPSLAERPQPMSLRGMHELVMPQLVSSVPPRGAAGAPARVLDLGAGQGALSALLLQAGYDVAACDLHPEFFRCQGVECRRSNAHDRLPFPDAHFDMVAAFEIVEHLESHAGLFREVARVLRPGGTLVFTTPNIVSLKSRLSFLFSGYFYSHGPLDPRVVDPVAQHISPSTPDRYRFLLAQAGLDLRRVACDRWGSTSTWMSWLAPIIRAWTWWTRGRRLADRHGVKLQNSTPALLGRTLVGIAVRD
jgi:SAM-dependent methyltransferase